MSSFLRENIAGTISFRHSLAKRSTENGVGLQVFSACRVRACLLAFLRGLPLELASVWLRGRVDCVALSACFAAVRDRVTAATAGERNRAIRIPCVLRLPISLIILSRRWERRSRLGKPTRAASKDSSTRKKKYGAGFFVPFLSSFGESHRTLAVLAKTFDVVDYFLLYF